MTTHTSIWGELFDVPIRQHFPVVNGIRTRVLEAGEGPPLVFVHGTGGHLECYAKNLRELSQHARVVTFDMIGHGASDKPDRPYTIDVMSDHLVGLLDELNIGQVNLSGLSIGAWVAAWTAAHHPDRVERLVLNAPGNVVNRREIMATVKETSLKAVREATVESVRDRLEWLFYDKSQVSDELVRIRLAIYGKPEYYRATEKMVVLQDWEVRERFAWSEEWCSKIKAPTLLVWTDYDPTAKLEDAAVLEAWIPDTRLVVLRDTGHWPQWERTAQFNEVLLGFLEGN
jgi:2-hydroxy-6-oxonona-2,4-dienedioate hydrolase